MLISPDSRAGAMGDVGVATIPDASSMHWNPAKLRHNAPRNVCLNVYYALFYSHLIYGCNIWGITTEENLDKIVKLQKKC